MVKLIYRKTVYPPQPDGKIIADIATWQFIDDGDIHRHKHYTLRHGRWDTNLRIHGVDYDRVYTEKGVLYHRPGENMPLEDCKVILKADVVLCFLNNEPAKLDDY